MNVITRSTVSLLIATLGACTSPLDVHRFDNPEIRSLQQAQLKSIVPDEDRQKKLRKFFNPRVGFIESLDETGAVSGSGRAARLTRDGYYLTARHVIDGGDFFLDEVTLNPDLARKSRSSDGIITFKSGEIDRYLTGKKHRGRIVWQREDLDLAIVKFDHHSPKYFSEFLEGPPRGTTVFSSDSRGRGFIPDGGSYDQSVGNGPFLAAGTVLATKPHRRVDGATRTFTDMVARGGMSGSPAATSDGRLVGILVSIRLSSLLPPHTDSELSMIPAGMIREIIATDRRESGSAR